MKRITFILGALVLFIILSGIYDPRLSIPEIKFKVFQYKNKAQLTVLASPNETAAKSLEVVWSTGDTGNTIIVRKSGFYKVSVKDKWTIAGQPGYSRGIFVKGLPDQIRIDTIILPNTLYGKPIWANLTKEKTFLLNINGKKVRRTVTTFSRCYDPECDSTIWTEAHPEWVGFWSGFIDSVKVVSYGRPLAINAKIIVKEKKSNIKNVWGISR